MAEMAGSLSSSPETAPRLITIPVEIRLNILSSLFSSTTVHHGFQSQHKTRSKSKSESTAITSILRVCKQLHEEASPLLPRHVLLHFRSPSAMLDVLTTLPQITIEKIRHIRLKSFPFPLYAKPQPSYYTTYNMSETICMVPGLQLDTLTVEDCYHGDGINDGWGDLGTYWDMESLLMVDGWKELRYITPSTKFMTGRFDSHKSRARQPDNWHQKIQDKDQGSPDAFVKMYLANSPKLKGLTSNPTTRTDWEVIPGHLIKRDPTEDQDSDDEEDDREVMVLAQRGTGVNYTQDGTGLDKDIKWVLEQMSWQELKASDKYIDGENDPTAHL